MIIDAVDLTRSGLPGRHRYRERIPVVLLHQFLNNSPFSGSAEAGDHNQFSFHIINFYLIFRCAPGLRRPRRKPGRGFSDGIHEGLRRFDANLRSEKSCINRILYSSSCSGSDSATARPRIVSGSRADSTILSFSMTITDFVFLPCVASIVRPSLLAWETRRRTGAESGLTIAMILPALTILPKPTCISFITAIYCTAQRAGRISESCAGG